MVIRAVRLPALLPLATRMHFIVLGVVLLFLPAVRAGASVFKGAAVGVGGDEVFGLPLRALFSLV
jgi:hypothetical protein